MSPQAERVWTVSEEYIRLAQAFLEPVDDRYAEGNVLWKREELRVSFLFPNRPERTLQDLCKVRCRFLGVGAARTAERKERSQGAASGAEHREADAVASQKEAEGACSGFSIIQQEILREKFFVRFNH